MSRDSLRLPGPLRKLLENASEAQRRRTEKETEKYIADEKDWFDGLRNPASNASAAPEPKKKRRRTLFYRLTGVTPLRLRYVYPLRPTWEQRAAEEWWFSLPDGEKSKLLPSEGFAARIVRPVLAAADGAFSPLARFFWTYWFVCAAFAALAVLFALCAAGGSVWIAAAGAAASLYLLYFSKNILIKRRLGLRIFCPLTAGWLAQAEAARPGENGVAPRTTASELNEQTNPEEVEPARGRPWRASDRRAGGKYGCR